ncbi:MAG: hypothetical protein HON90_05125 [Halobacteriovoraceae bacterium]|jgi:hypothetical protein|nr:hypothetical protein [Halobacteriovoraceae bacterium]
MKKNIYAFICIILPQYTLASTLFLPSHIMEVVTDSQYNSTGVDTIYRAIVFSDGKEGAVSIGIEKYQRGEYGSPDKVLIQKKLITSNIKGFRKLIGTIAKTSVEATYGCCRPTALKWTKNNVLEFSLKYEKRVFDRGFDVVDGKKVAIAQYSHTEVSTFNCSTASLSTAINTDARCSRVNFQKLKKE